jgi:hypothetical protein
MQAKQGPCPGGLNPVAQHMLHAPGLSHRCCAFVQSEHAASSARAGAEFGTPKGIFWGPKQITGRHRNRRGAKRGPDLPAAPANSAGRWAALSAAGEAIGHVAQVSPRTQQRLPLSRLFWRGPHRHNRQPCCDDTCAQQAPKSNSAAGVGRPRAARWTAGKPPHRIPDRTRAKTCGGAR